MPESRHFTVVDDWVMLNPDVTATEYRVYSIIKGNLKHTHGGIPETGFRATAAWVCGVSGGLVAVSTAHKAMQGLAKKGVLRRLNNPQSGEGADFEFVISPEEDYTGSRSVMAKASEVGQVKSRSVVFVTIPLDRSPRKGRRTEGVMPPDLRMGGMGEALEEDSGTDGEEPEFDMSALGGGVPTGSEAEFAAELEEITSRNTAAHLRLMTGACERLAAAARDALERGWEPRLLARRLASELNPRINMPERLLLGKIKDIGAPPKTAATITQPVEGGPSGRYVPPKQFRGRERLELTPEEQEKVNARLAEHQARRARAERLK